MHIKLKKYWNEKDESQSHTQALMKNEEKRKKGETRISCKRRN